MNLLKNERSPYLLQHKDNPIHWMPWGDDAFAKARRDNKPIFLSVGYSTCHWCHVMAHESFEDQEVAQVLNDQFVCIKLDREERPDVDDIYMTALQAISGGGGWPMSIWMNAEGKPFFAGTYFPKYRFLQLLRRIDELWKTENEKLSQDGDRLLASVQSMGLNEVNEEISEADYEEFLKTYINHFQSHFDEKHGGFGHAPKFPQTMNLMVMMRQDRQTGLRQAEAIVNGTLVNMVRGGIYDQLAGGFHRYSVDEIWLVPHFEKMLYDQALLSVTLIEGFQNYGEAELARGARETLDYVLREMTHKEGGFYSAQDADSLDPIKGHSEEGYFCTYSFAELRASLTDAELDLLQKAYGVSEAGNFEGRNILHLQNDFDGSVKADALIVSAFAKLKKLRAAKPVPHLDDKVISAWNGWMVWALVKGAMVFQEPRYLEAARKAMTFLRENLSTPDGGLRRFWRDGMAVGHGAAEDYASMIHACLELYQADFDVRWADWAMSLQKTFDSQFWDSEEGLYFSNDGQDKLLPLRPKDDYDGVTPCSNSMAKYNLERIFLLNGDARLKHQATRITRALFPKLKQHPSGLPFLALGIDFELAASKVAVLNGPGWVNDFYLERSRLFEPYLIWAHVETQWPVTLGKATATPSIYICERGQCLKPALKAEDARAQILPPG